ncbi:MAG: T9SS type A sorting domain-containing protein [Flavobacteriaceae bacterium]|nr:T9SS type A sorting domain-containing protein [Flavobacteriaceae bacterium]
MKQIYLTLVFIVISFYGYGQIACPTEVKDSGMSTTGAPILVVPNGQNGCSEAWPATVTVNGNLTYNFVGCTGGQLKYEIETGQTPPTTFETTWDFGGGLICSYDANGKPRTLSNSENKLDVSLSPNPGRDIINIKLDDDSELENIIIYTITGQQVYKSSNSTRINISNLNSGTYIIELNTNKGTIIKKIIVN